MTVMFLIPALALGWTAPTLSCVCNSAAPAGGTVEVNADCYNQQTDETSARLFYSLDNQATWTESAMTRTGYTGYDSTFVAAFAVAGPGTVYYYVRSDNGTNIGTQAPFNAGNSWPPSTNLLALAANDPVGDARDPEGNWMDLTGAFIGYSADRFYVKLTNNHTGWPTYSFPQPWYIYSLGFMNPAAPSDTWVFSLSYADIPGIFATGLYLINRFTADYTRIADAQSQTNGNQLFLSCALSDLVGNPRFGPWPNQSGWLAAAANTQAIYPIGGSEQRDTTNTARFYADRTPRFTVGQNTAPALSSPRVVPESGGATTPFRFSVTYTDSDTNLPRTHAVVVDEDTFVLAPRSHSYAAGVSFQAAESTFIPGWRRFCFLFDDGMAQVSTPPDSFFVDGTGLSDAGTLAPGAVVLSVSPNPFTGFTTVRLSANAIDSSPIVISLFDASGRLVCSLSASRASYRSAFTWDGRNTAGRTVPPGVYFASVPGSRARVVKSGD